MNDSFVFTPMLVILHLEYLHIALQNADDMNGGSVLVISLTEINTDKNLCVCFD